LNMSTAETAVKTFRKLQPQDFRVLLAIELSMSRHQHVPEDTIPKLANLTQQEITYRLPRLRKLRLIRRWKGPYTGYQLNQAGYDCLAINALVKAEVLEAFGKPLGVGKEADVYNALTPNNQQVAVKFHRLGRTSFRQTKRKRGYIAQRQHISWLYQSRLAAQKEYEALKLVYPHGIAVPKPIQQNRHVIVMSMIEGAELTNYTQITKPQNLLNEILLNIRKAYQEVGVIHADLSEFNVIVKPDEHILIIDWPQYVKRNHPNANQLLKRDIKNIVHFFQRKFNTKTRLKEALTYVKETSLPSQ
jgi:RIO kinase 2